LIVFEKSIWPFLLWNQPYFTSCRRLAVRVFNAFAKTFRLL